VFLINGILEFQINETNGTELQIIGIAELQIDGIAEFQIVEIHGMNLHQDSQEIQFQTLTDFAIHVIQRMIW
jgi:hypothetical protein